MNETDTTDFDQHDDDGAESASGPRPRLIRPREPRLIGGVASGLAHYMGIPRWLVRVLFVGLSVMGGIGVALYIIGWLLISDEGEDHNVAEDLVERFRGGDRGWIGIVLIVVAILILFNPWAGSRLFWAVGLALVGYLLYTGHLNFGGGSREPPPGSGHGPGSDPPPPEPPSPPETSDDPSEVAQPLPDDTTSESPASPEDAGLHPAEVMELESLNNSFWEQEIAATAPPVETRPTPTRPPSYLGKLTLAAALVIVAGLGVMILTDLLFVAPGHLWAIGLAVIGAGLLVGSVIGRARWLILLGVLLIPLALIAPVGGPPFSDANTVRSPVSFDDLGSDVSLDQPFGSMHYDLTNLPWDGENVTLDLGVGVGVIEVDVPDTVAVISSLEVGAGVVTINDDDTPGGGVVVNRELPGTSGTVTIEADVGAGVIDVDQLREDGGAQ